MTEEWKWRSFKYNLNKKDRKLFDEMFAISRLYNYASSNCVMPGVVSCILMSIIFHHYKQIIQLTKQTRVRVGKLSNVTQWDELVN
jgi:hypothetical protein